MELPESLLHLIQMLRSAFWAFRIRLGGMWQSISTPRERAGCSIHLDQRFGKHCAPRLLPTWFFLKRDDSAQLTIFELLILTFKLHAAEFLYHLACLVSSLFSLFWIFIKSILTQHDLLNPLMQKHSLPRMTTSKTRRRTRRLMKVSQEKTLNVIWFGNSNFGCGPMRAAVWFPLKSQGQFAKTLII